MHFLKLPCGLTASVRFPGPTQTQLLKVSESMEKEIIEQVYYKCASQNNNKNRVYEENQAKFLKNAEGRLSYLLELKEKLSSKTTQEEPPSRDNND